MGYGQRVAQVLLGGVLLGSGAMFGAQEALNPGSGGGMSVPALAVGGGLALVLAAFVPRD